MSSFVDFEMPIKIDANLPGSLCLDYRNPNEFRLLLGSFAFCDSDGAKIEPLTWQTVELRYKIRPLKSWRDFCLQIGFTEKDASHFDRLKDVMLSEIKGRMKEIPLRYYRDGKLTELVGVGFKPVVLEVEKESGKVISVGVLYEGVLDRYYAVISREILKYIKDMNSAYHYRFVLAIMGYVRMNRKKIENKRDVCNLSNFLVTISWEAFLEYLGIDKRKRGPKETREIIKRVIGFFRDIGFIEDVFLCPPLTDNQDCLRFKALKSRVTARNKRMGQMLRPGRIVFTLPFEKWT